MKPLIIRNMKNSAKIDFRSSAMLFFSILMSSPFTGSSQENLNTIKIWEGWKIGNVIKVSGTIKYGDPMHKGEEDKRYLVVQSIDDKALESEKTIEILYHKELFSKIKDGEALALLGYASGGFSGIPNFNDYDLEYWQDKLFGFSLYFVVLKMGEEIKMKKK
jgi:hypothetical protein